MRVKMSEVERFWSYVDKGGDCWVWKRAIHTYGYGVFHLSKERGCALVSAHRYSWELAHGPIVDGLFVLHKCDNPPCVNPNHLFLGTQKINVRDAALKGRIHTTKLSKEKAEAIRDLYMACTKARGTIKRLAEHFGVHRHTIQNAIGAKTFKPLYDDDDDEWDEEY